MTFSVLTHARTAPTAVALVTEGREVSFAELAGRVCAVVAGLRARGVRFDGHDPPVAFVASRSEASLGLLYALIEMGVVAVPIHARWTPEERRAALDRLGPHLWIEGPTDVADHRWADHRWADHRWADHRWADHGPADLAQADLAQAEPRARVDPGAPLAILHTSGSSGVPKAAVLSRAALQASAVASAANLGWAPGDRWTLDISFAHVGGLSVVTRTLLAGRPIVVGPEAPFSPEGFVNTIVRGGARIASVVPTMLVRLLRDAAAVRALQRLRVLLVGGAATSPLLLADADALGLPVVTTYGLTELGSQVATGRPGGVRPIGVGWPLEGVDLVIEDGEIAVGGAARMDGYWIGGRLQRPFRDGRFPTGDLGTFAHDGSLIVFGRRDDRISTGGEEVDPSEVEAALSRCPGVEGVCVVGVPDPEWGARVVAAVVGSPRAEDLERAMSTLAPFKWPWEVRRMRGFETGSSGKVDRRRTAAVLETAPVQWARTRAESDRA